ncbi:Disease resistance-like protein DSC1 [Linum perenne]
MTKQIRWVGHEQKSNQYSKLPTCSPWKKSKDQNKEAIFCLYCNLMAAPLLKFYSGQWEYDVFLCFRGDDTRYGFTSHLMAALSDKQIKTFIDDNLNKTDSINQLISILERCALSVVVFSHKFADSVWCLEEVVAIARKMAESGHLVLPIFYKVQPSDVTDASGSYATTISRKFESDEDAKRWLDALKDVANCVGHTSQAIQIESELIKTIVEDVQKQLIDMSPPVVSSNLVGMSSRILKMEKLLAIDTLDDTRIIGLWGMGGVGKTTLAKACYERIASSKKGKIKCHFVRNINGVCERCNGVERIVHELYSKLLSEDGLSCEDLDISYRRIRLSRLRVFIVLDDVETPSQLEQLLLGDVAMNPAKLFAKGSRVIVTTRNKRVLQYAMAMVYNVEGLSSRESIQLFSLRAFRQHRPRVNWMNLSCLATSCCMGNPLALVILGGTLFGHDKQYWQSFLSELRLIRDPKIHDILRRSYDKLEVDERRIFLDVACFLHGMSKARLIEYMETMHQSAYVKVNDLIDKSLLTCVISSHDSKIDVHDLLKEIAWTIVNEEPKLGKRSRLVDPDDIHKLLSTLEEHRATEGIRLKLFAGAKEIHLKANAFEGMYSLTYLKIWSSVDFPMKKKIHLPYDGLDSLPDGLRLLHWDGYPSRSLPSKFHPQHLVYLIIRGSPIRICWQGNDHPQLVNLMVLQFSYCKNLTAIPDISRSSKLEELLLKDCSSLVELPSHVQYLTKLIKLKLRHCKNLKRLPNVLDSKLLKFVWISYCPNVAHCPKIYSEELEVLDLSGTPVRELPSAIYSVKYGGFLDLYGKYITNFPAVSTSLGQFNIRNTAMTEIELTLPRFVKVRLFGNAQLERLPKSIWNMVSGALVVQGSPLLESLPEVSEPINGLTCVSITECDSLKTVPSSINNIKSLKSLDLSKTDIKSLPSSIQELVHLTRLDLGYCKSLESIPSTIQKLVELSRLYLTGCSSIRYLPQLPSKLKKLDVSGCKSLQALPSNTAKLLRLESLRFDDCPQLDPSLPDEIVTNFPGRMISSPRQCKLLCSGSELPKWFVYQGMKNMNELKLPLPELMISVKGMAFGVVCSWDTCNSWPIMKCDCEIDDGTIVASWSSNYWSLNGGENSSDCLLMWFDTNLSGKTMEVRDEAWNLKYAGLTVSFRFHPTVLSPRPKNLRITRCGVSLMFG